MTKIKISKIQVGSVSSGTMRPEDLIPTFTGELLSIDRNNKVGNHVNRILNKSNADQLQEYFDSEDSGYDLDALFDELNNVCDLPYVHFGSHEGDGSDYGFWIEYNEVEDDAKYGDLKIIENEVELEKDYTGQVAFKSEYEYRLYNVVKGKLTTQIW